MSDVWKNKLFEVQNYSTYPILGWQHNIVAYRFFLLRKPYSFRFGNIPKSNNYKLRFCHCRLRKHSNFNPKAIKTEKLFILYILVNNFVIVFERFYTVSYYLSAPKCSVGKRKSFGIQHKPALGVFYGFSHLCGIYLVY